MCAPDDGVVVGRVGEEVLFLEFLSPMAQLGMRNETSRFRGATFTSIVAGEPATEGFPQPRLFIHHVGLGGHPSVTERGVASHTQSTNATRDQQRFE